MITINRIRQRLRRVRINWQARRAIAYANRVKARTLRGPNPGYDELSHPLFLIVMALGFLAVVVDVAEQWDGVLWTASMVVDFVRTFGLVGV